jgi:hypothetical protein
MRRLKLPVITSLEIKGYSLFPGRDGSNNLRHTFPPGVSVIVGVNGQGKTTLLNILFRTLIGPWDQSKADYAAPGRRQHQLTEIKRFDYFVARAETSDFAATAEITIQFGKEKVRLCRSLNKNLQIEGIWHGRKHISKPTEEQWTRLVEQLSGMSGLYDFHFVVRHFLFFLEDKIPLLWNPFGQFEILRILFLNKSLSAQCAELHDKILREDSIYRNMYWQNSLRNARLQELRQQLTADPDVKASVESLVVLSERLASAETAVEEAGREVNRLLTQIEKHETELFKLQIKLADTKAALEIAERRYLEVQFPTADSTTEMVFSYVLAGDRCLVCGTERHKGQSYLREQLARHRCPACNSQLGRQPNSTKPSQAVLKRLQKNQTIAEQVERETARLEESIRIDREALLDQMKVRSDVQQMLTELRIQKQYAENKEQLPAELASIEQEIQENELNLREKGELLQSLRTEYEKRLNEANSQIEGAAQAILDRFKVYADQFLLEKAILRYEFHERPIGQSGQALRFPNFVVGLSFSDSTEPTERAEIDQVSESQREFIDLAFRMALLDVAVSTLGPAMIAIETPESSLDAVFVSRAGQMLRAFAQSHPNNRVIATCNINGEGMIGWLLGTVGKTPRTVSMESLTPQILNLLEVGRRTKAYEAEKATYDGALKRAIYGH